MKIFGGFRAENLISDLVKMPDPAAPGAEKTVNKIKKLGAPAIPAVIDALALRFNLEVDPTCVVPRQVAEPVPAVSSESWERREFDVVVGDDARAITFELMVVGSGTAFLDALSIEVVP